MKKNILKIMALCLACILAMAGCGKKQEVKETVPTTVETTEPTVEMTEGLVIIEEGLGIWYEGPDTASEEEGTETRATEETKSSATDRQKQNNSNGNANAAQKDDKEPAKESSNKPTTEPTKAPAKDQTTEPTKTPAKEPATEPTKEPSKESTAEPTVESTEPDAGKEETKQTEPVETVPQETIDNCEYQRYMSMSAAEQQSYYESFGDPNAFFSWFTKAQQEHEAHRNVTIIEGDASLDLNDYVEGNQ